jgi:uncharacterized damage-inducible protein DinB
MSFSQSLLPEFDEEMKSTRKLLERVPDGKFDYQPHAKSMTLGRLATHVAELPSWLAMTLGHETVEIPTDYAPQIAKNRAEVLAIFDKNVADARTRIQAATDEEWNKIWTLKWGGRTIISMPRTAVVRATVMNHLIHHRAQLGVFLRLNDVEIPGMYGPSADEMNAWQSNA